MNSSLEFTETLRRYLEVLGEVVWDSFRKGLRSDEEWPEEDFFAALVTQGFRGSDSRTQRLLEELRAEKPYSIEFKLVRHNQQTMEPLTGADLAVLVDLRVDSRNVLRRVFLVQLKKAVMRNDRVAFEDLHHHSGKKYFGRDLHQAERMLLFSPCSVFWLASHPYLTSDKSFLRAYSEQNNFAQRARDRVGKSNAHSSQTESFGGLLHSFGVTADPRLWRHLHYYWEEYADLVGRPPKQLFQEAQERVQLAEQDRLIRTLRVDAASETAKLHGMQARMPVLVAHAESVLALADAKVTDLQRLYDASVSLAEFILGEVVSDGFGDAREELIEALVTPRPNDYVKRTVREFGLREAETGDVEPVRAVIRAELNLVTGAAVTRG